jgi:hypothetical protein
MKAKNIEEFNSLIDRLLNNTPLSKNKQSSNNKEELKFLFKNLNEITSVAPKEEAIISSLIEFTIIGETYTFDTTTARAFKLTLTQNTTLTLPTLENGTALVFTAFITGNFTLIVNDVILTAFSSVYNGNNLNKLVFNCFKDANGVQTNILTLAQPLPPSYLLDNYPNARVAYSLRYLKSDFVGNNVILVKRDNDNMTAGFTPDEIIDGTLENWVGIGNTGRVIRWYDQCGSNIDLYENANDTPRPTIVENGVLNIDNGKPFVRYVDGGGNTPLRVTSTGLNNTLGSIFMQFNSNTTNTITLVGNGNGNVFIGTGELNSTGASTQFAGTPAYYKNGNFIANAPNRDVTYNTYKVNKDVQAAFLNCNFSNANWDMQISPFVNYYNSREVKAKEFIAYNNDQTGNRIPITQEIINYYNITEND